MPRFADPVPAPSAKKSAPSPAAARPPARRLAPAQQAALSRVLQLRAGERAADAPSPKAESRSALPERLRTGVERLSGLAMDDVRVHRDSPEPARLGALAYTQGSDIHLGPGQEQHLPHEAWHVVQQKQGRVTATTQLKGVGVNEDAGLEAEADRMGGRIAAASPTALQAARPTRAPREAGPTAVQLARETELKQDGPLKPHELKEPAASYVAALRYEQGTELKYWIKKVAGAPKSDGFATAVVEEMKSKLIGKCGWVFDMAGRDEFKFGSNLYKENEIWVGGPTEGPYTGRGPAGEPEATLQAAFDQAVAAVLAERQKAADEKAAKKARKD